LGLSLRRVGGGGEDRARDALIARVRGRERKEVEVGRGRGTLRS